MFRNLHRLLDVNGEMLVAFVAQSPLYSVYGNLAKKSRWQKYMGVGEWIARRDRNMLQYVLQSRQ